MENESKNNANITGTRALVIELIDDGNAAGQRPSVQPAHHLISAPSSAAHSLPSVRPLVEVPNNLLSNVPADVERALQQIIIAPRGNRPLTGSSHAANRTLRTIQQNLSPVDPQATNSAVRLEILSNTNIITGPYKI
jgi:hypothetical protein